MGRKKLTAEERWENYVAKQTFRRNQKAWRQSEKKILELGSARGNCYRPDHKKGQDAKTEQKR